MDLPETIAAIKANPFFGTSGPRATDIMLVGESWGAEEETKCTPFIGLAGHELDRILAEAGILRASCFITNVVPARPPDNKLSAWFTTGVPIWGCVVEEVVFEGLRALKKQIEVVQPQVIVCLGAFAFWALCREAPLSKLPKKDGGHMVPSGITAWRGSMLTSRVEYGDAYKVLPTLHPSYINRSWTERPYLVHDLKARVPQALEDKWTGRMAQRLFEPPFDVALTFLETILDRADREPVKLVCDIETRGRNITCIGFATSTTYSICIPLVKLREDRGLDSYWPEVLEFELFVLLRRVLLHPNMLLVGQNFLYDMQYLSVWLALGDGIKCHFDTMCAQHTMFPGTEKGLDILSSLYCEHHVFWKHETQEWAATGTLQQLLAYNCTDTLKTFEIFSELCNLLDILNYWHQFDYMMATLHSAFDMMLRGLRRDETARVKMGQEVEAALKPREEYLLSMLPQDWVPGRQKTSWLTSPAQQRALFYEVLGLPTILHRKTKQPTIDDEALNILKEKVPLLSQVFDVMAELRSLHVFNNLYVKARKDPDDRFRTSLNPAGTETFRFSSSKTVFHRGANLQNISAGDE